MKEEILRMWMPAPTFVCFEYYYIIILRNAWKLVNLWLHCCRTFISLLDLSMDYKLTDITLWGLTIQWKDLIFIIVECFINLPYRRMVANLEKQTLPGQYETALILKAQHQEKTSIKFLFGCKKKCFSIKLLKVVLC